MSTLYPASNNANSPELTAYQLTCGYVQRKEPRPGVVTSLTYNHGRYELGTYDFNLHKRLLWSIYTSWRTAQDAFRLA